MFLKQILVNCSLYTLNCKRTSKQITQQLKTPPPKHDTLSFYHLINSIILLCNALYATSHPTKNEFTFIFRKVATPGKRKARATVRPSGPFFRARSRLSICSLFSSYLLPLFVCLILFLLFPCASVRENNLARVPHFL